MLYCCRAGEHDIKLRKSTCEVNELKPINGHGSIGFRSEIPGFEEEARTYSIHFVYRPEYRRTIEVREMGSSFYLYSSYFGDWNWSLQEGWRCWTDSKDWPAPGGLDYREDKQVPLPDWLKETIKEIPHQYGGAAVVSIHNQLDYCWVDISFVEICKIGRIRDLEHFSEVMLNRFVRKAKQRLEGQTA